VIGGDLRWMAGHHAWPAACTRACCSPLRSGVRLTSATRSRAHARPRTIFARGGRMVAHRRMPESWRPSLNTGLVRDKL